MKLEKEQQQKEMLLEALDKELKQRLATVEKIKDQIEKSLKQVDDQDKGKFQNTVKLYEGMKPKDAAEIMNKLDMKNLKTIVQLMNKRKASEVLGFMDKAKVRELTVAMMNQKTPFASSTQSNG